MSLNEILARARRDSVEFPYLLSNHAPMAVIALHRLGATDDRLVEWFESYRAANGLVAPPPPVAPIAPESWDDALGDRARETDYRVFFTAEVRRLGMDSATRRYAPRLFQGVAGSALHPLMRLAYATMMNDPEEAGVALGYWAACHLQLPRPNGQAPDTDDPAAVLAAVATIDGVRDYQTETDLLWHNIRAVAALPGFGPVVDRLNFGPDTPRRMAATSLALFAATMDFAALHALTGLHWVRLLTASLDDPEPLYRAFWQVIAALVPKIGFPSFPGEAELAEMRNAPAPPWPDIYAAATASSDEHDISLAFSARAEEAVWGDPLYRVVAARRLGLLG
jgi:Questin oxidase-like